MIKPVVAVALLLAGCGASVTQSTSASAWPEPEDESELHSAVWEAVETSFLPAPTLELAWVRRSGSAAIDWPIRPAEAMELAERGAEWIAYLRSEEYLVPDIVRRCQYSTSARCALFNATRESLMATRDALARNSRDPAPLRRLREAIAGIEIRPNCSPSLEDAARAAALAHRTEFETGPQDVVVVPGSLCIEVDTLGGRLRVESGAEPSGSPFLEIGAPEDLQEPCEEGCYAVVPYHWYADPRAGERGEIHLILTNGVWRVTEATMTSRS